MTGTTDQGIATLMQRLAGQEMLGFSVAEGVTAASTTKVGSPKPPPVAAGKGA